MNVQTKGTVKEVMCDETGQLRELVLEVSVRSETTRSINVLSNDATTIAFDVSTGDFVSVVAYATPPIPRWSSGELLLETALIAISLERH